MNNLLKSVFVSAYSSYTMVVTLVAVVLATRDGSLAWAGVALVHAPMAALFARVALLRDLPRSHPMLPLISAATIAGLFVTTWAQPAWGTPLALTTLGVLGYFLYLGWYSRFGRKPTAALAMGAKLPALALQTADGAPFDITALRGAPAVLLFYRGNWCPLCMAQIKEVAAQYRVLAERGIEVCMISPQSHRKTQALAARFDAPMRFLVDPGNRSARALGIAWAHAIPAGIQVLGYASESVLPTVIVVDASGTIVLADQTDNYRIRPEPDTFIAALDAAPYPGQQRVE